MADVQHDAPSRDSTRGHEGPPRRADATRASTPGQVVVDVDQGAVQIDGLVCTDRVLFDLLVRQGEKDRADTVARALAVGARGLVSMGIGLDVGELDARVRATVNEQLVDAQRRIERLFEQAGRAMEAGLDPDTRTSLVGRAISEFAEWRDGFLAGIDPDSTDSHTGRLLERIDALAGPDGELEHRLRSMLDAGDTETGLGKALGDVSARLSEMRDLIVDQQARRDEADRGTAKGVDFEDRLEEVLRRALRGTGATVERTSRTSGNLGGDAMVGDYVVTVGSGERIAVEAKNTRTVGLTGDRGILAELDRAMANRNADLAICVSAEPAYPAEVGPIGVYGKRILVVDDGEGTMIWVALRWAETLLRTAGRLTADGPDLETIQDRLQRLRHMAQSFSSTKRSLTEIGGSVERIRSTLEDMRRDLLGLVADIDSEIGRARDRGEVIPIRAEAG